MPATTFIGHFLGPDIHANRPTATGLPNGTHYVCTTHTKIERVVSGAWVDYATLGTPTTGQATYTGTGVPSGGTGALGDLYLDQANNFLYQKRTFTGGPPAFRSLATTEAANATNHPATMPAGVQAGDFLIALVHIQRGSGPTAPAAPTGWTRQAEHTYQTSYNDALYTRTADGSEGSTVTFTTPTNHYSAIGILAYSSNGGLDAFADYGSSQTSSTPQVPAITTTVANAMLVGVGGEADSGGGTTATPASGWTERLEFKQTTPSSFIYGMEKLQATAGASAAAAIGGPNLNYWWTYTVAVKPSAGGTGWVHITLA